MEDKKYFQEVILREKEFKYSLVKPNPEYEKHVTGPKALAWVSSINRYYDGITYQPKKDTNGFNQLDKALEFKNKEGGNAVRLIFNHVKNTLKVLNTIENYARCYYGDGVRHYKNFDKVKADWLDNRETANFVPRRRKYQIFFHEN